MLAKVNSCIVIGVEGVTLEIEVDISTGLPMFSTVGLPDGSVRESKDRVKAAINNSGYTFPNKRITVNLAPADLKKEGAGFDLPIAIGILSASGLVPDTALANYSMIGELSLDGSVRAVRGLLPMVLNAKNRDMCGVIIPHENVGEASIIENIDIIGVRSLHEVIDFLLQKKDIKPIKFNPDEVYYHPDYDLDFNEVKGQENAKRAFEVAAAGNHNILMKGPPGAGKTMLAKRLPTILPLLNLDDAIETTKIHSIAGTLDSQSPIIVQRPFRSPHHSISDAGLIGGGSHPKPGEVSLAHNGVLFLDELTEFKKNLLEMLRQPLEERRVLISRASMSLCYPANFLLVAAFNPCPCGYFGDKRNSCICSPAQIHRYATKLSGPLLDRMDIQVEIAALQVDEISVSSSSEKSASIRKRVEEARLRQSQRFAGEKEGNTNSTMGPKMVEKFCQINHESKSLLERGVEKLGLSARAYHRILKISRTIADLDGSEMIEKVHLAEAINYRRTFYRPISS